ncbi:hypothetical protein HPB51_012588 [Rhipicephalus microplus]|uniref:Uncharacterized protein n=1 Tax=Rhipicephalus microplus TaxID=6941 RepID=A0A9J6DH26_RHIMP|nr:hypothetical protein HPB51_012588 [Rhipicephalus microplus]
MCACMCRAVPTRKTTAREARPRGCVTRAFGSARAEWTAQPPLDDRSRRAGSRFLNLSLSRWSWRAGAGCLNLPLRRCSRRAGVGFRGGLQVLKGTTPCRRNTCVVGSSSSTVALSHWSSTRRPCVSRPRHCRRIETHRSVVHDTIPSDGFQRTTYTDTFEHNAPAPVPLPAATPYATLQSAQVSLILQTLDPSCVNPTYGACPTDDRFATTAVKRVTSTETASTADLGCRVFLPIHPAPGLDRDHQKLKILSLGRTSHSGESWRQVPEPVLVPLVVESWRRVPEPALAPLFQEGWRGFPRRTAGAQGHNSLPPEHVCRRLQFVDSGAEPLEFDAATLRLPTSSLQVTTPHNVDFTTEWCRRGINDGPGYYPDDLNCVTMGRKRSLYRVEGPVKDTLRDNLPSLVTPRAEK